MLQSTNLTKLEIARQKCIDQLIEDDVNDIEQELNDSRQANFLDHILRNGYKGYEQMTHEELQQEYRDRFIDKEDFNDPYTDK